MTAILRLAARRITRYKDIRASVGNQRMNV